MRLAFITLLTLLITVALVTTDKKDSIRSRNDDKKSNAAVAYWQAIECIIDRNQADSTYPEFLRIIREGHEAPLDEKALKAMHRSGLALYFLHRGTRVGECDWGLAIDEVGPRAEQGHLSHVPKLAGAACLRARYYFNQHRPQEAIGDLIAVLRLAKHAGNEGRDGTRALITQVAMEAKVVEIAARHLPQLDAASANGICAQMTPLSVRDILKNFLAAQHLQWVQWSRRFAEHARKHDGDWNAYWRQVRLRDANSGTEVGELLRKAANGIPERLLNLASDAAAVFDQATKLADLPKDEFRPAWRALLEKSEENRIVELAGGEVEPILDNLIMAETRRALFRSGVVVARNGRQALKDLKDRSGPFEYRVLKDGFELISKHKLRGEPLRLVFGQSKDGAEGR